MHVCQAWERTHVDRSWDRQSLRLGQKACHGRVGEMTQQVNTFATKPDNLSSIYMVEGENCFPQTVF